MAQTTERQGKPMRWRRAVLAALVAVALWTMQVVPVAAHEPQPSYCGGSKWLVTGGQVWRYRLEAWVLGDDGVLRHRYHVGQLGLLGPFPVWTDAHTVWHRC